MTKARDLANASTALTTVSATELGYLDGVTSPVQTQLNAKQPTVANVSDTEIGYLDGVTSAIQTQLNAKAPTASPTFTGNVTSGGSFVAPNDGYVYWGPGDGSTSIQGNSSTDVIKFNTASNERAKIDSNGFTISRTDSSSEGGQLNLLRSLDNGSAYALDVVGNTTATTFRVVNTAAGTAPLTIDSTGSTIVNNTYISNGAVRNIFMSTSDPSGGSSGDVWIKYTP